MVRRTLVNKKRLIIFEIISALVVVGLAFLFHFLFKMSGYNNFVGLFAATNESVFEHTKILFYPFILVSIFEYFFIDVDFSKFFVAKTVSALFLIAIVIVFFYTYKGIIGYNISLVDMLSAVVYPFIAVFISYKLIMSKKDIGQYFMIAVVILTAVVILMITVTLYPPKIALFYDNSHEIYGMYKN